MRFVKTRRRLLVISLAMALLCGAGGALLGLCGPFTDVSDAAFCPFVLEIFYQGITTGTTPSTYDPASGVSRLQMAAFLSRSVDGVLKRGSRRAALKQFWTPQDAFLLARTTVAGSPQLVESDGSDLWVASLVGTVARVRASDGKLLETWTGASSASAVLPAVGRVFVCAASNPGKLYQIDPSQAAGVVTTVASNLGSIPVGIAFDGRRVWTANQVVPGGVSIVAPGPSIPWTVTTVTTGFSALVGILYDGANIWVTDPLANKLFKLDAAGAILQTVTVGDAPRYPAFDGTSLWVPDSDSDAVSVVRASTGAVLATLTGNGLDNPQAVAFDGQRILVTNTLGDSVSLWKAADLTALGTFPAGIGTHPHGACSDGVNFWIVLNLTSQLARF